MGDCWWWFKADFAYDVTLQCNYPRNVAKLEQILGGPCLDCVQIMVKFARGNFLLVRRGLNLFVCCDPSKNMGRKNVQLDVFACGLPSRVMDIS